LAEIHGKNGGIYLPNGFIRAATISFNTSDNAINDAGNGLLTAGFTNGKTIAVSGTVSNNGVWTLAPTGITAGKMVVTTDNTTELEGQIVTIVTTSGTIAGGFFDWNLTLTAEAFDVTDFSNAGVKAFIVGQTGWTGSGNRNWVDDTSNPDNQGWLNAYRWVRFFVKYVAIPSSGTPAYYYEGLAICNSINSTTPNGDVVKQALTFQGVGALTPVTRTTAWD